MTDYNILNRASFDDMRKTFKLSIQPFIVQGGGVLDLGGPDNVFWIKSVSWKYNYTDVNIPTATRTKINKIKIAIENLFPQAIDTALPPFVEPRPMVGRIHFNVENTNVSNNHRLDIEFYLDGVLVVPRPGVEPPSLKEMKGYIMLDSTARGQEALKEAQGDKLDELLVQSGLGSLRDAIPGGGMSALLSLPPALQGAVLQGLAAKGDIPEFMIPSIMGAGAPLALGGSGFQQQPLALPDLDREKETSSFLGDLFATCPEECQDTLKPRHLKQIAVDMIEKGWRRV
jgi:hypothetical protein